MSYLYQELAARVDAWRAENYPSDNYPAIREILEFAVEDQETSQLRYLRRAQLRALETYWYLRLSLETPTIPALYDKMFPALPARLRAMGVDSKLFEEAGYDFNALIERVRTDNKFVRQHKLESLRESLTLDYPSGWCSGFSGLRSGGPQRFAQAGPAGCAGEADHGAGGGHGHTDRRNLQHPVRGSAGRHPAHGLDILDS